MADFRKLHVWARARALVKAIYECTATFPADERYGTTSQLRRAAISITANIAEGSARRSRREQARFYGIALASARELECLLIVTCDLGMLAAGSFAKHEAAVHEVERMLVGLVRAGEQLRVES